MLTVQVKLTIDDVISSIRDLNAIERKKLRNALVELEDEIALQHAIQEGLDDVEHGRVTPHEVVMTEIRAKYNF